MEGGKEIDSDEEDADEDEEIYRAEEAKIDKCNNCLRENCGGHQYDNFPGQCLKCHPLCKYCEDNSTNCSLCSDNTLVIHDNGVCRCKNHYYYDEILET